jgi:hypothetical protein
MSEEKKLPGRNRPEIAEGLLLPLGSDAMPFALNDHETKFGPEDWAWLFLSMNEKYVEAFGEHVKKCDVDKCEPYFRGDFEDEVNDKVWLDHDGNCAEQFGIAAWLRPSIETLPKLRSKDDSWFFPLKRLILEDYRRSEVSEKKYVRSGPTYSRHLDKYLHLVANETTFGYRRPLNTPTGEQRADEMLGITWVAVDCSIPPEGQMSALRALAVAHRQHLMDFGRKTNDRLDSFSVEDTSDSDAFEHLLFKRSAGATAKVKDLTTVWRAVQIDALGPIVKQTEKLTSTLRTIHQELVREGLAVPAQSLRFQNALPSMKDRDGELRNGGSYLKALVVIAELIRWGHDANKIAHITGVMDENHRYQYSWQKQFHENIERYIDEALRMVEGGYRLLIHTQKPAFSEKA